VTYFEADRAAYSLALPHLRHTSSGPWKTARVGGHEDILHLMKDPSFGLVEQV
jgi:hypothetical protein